MFPVSKILVIDVTVIPDMASDVALLKTYCLHIIPVVPMVTVYPSCVSVTVVSDMAPDVALLKIYCLHIIPGSPHGPC